MLLRIFTRKEARAVDPGDVLERPKPIRVEDVTKGLNGMSLWGHRPDAPDARRIQIKLEPGDPVESPVLDQDSIMGLLTEAFEALAKSQQEDEVGEAQLLRYEWLRDERAFRVRTPMGWVYIGLMADPKPEPAPPPEQTRPAKAAAKRRAKNPPAAAPTQPTPEAPPPST